MVIDMYKLGSDVTDVYQLEADMGGAGFVFTVENDADIKRNLSLTNKNILKACRRRNTRRIFYASSACVYSEFTQADADCPDLEEESAYSAQKFSVLFR
jgi:GDP-D-mannose 3',5'-epimerase